MGYDIPGRRSLLRRLRRLRSSIWLFALLLAPLTSVVARPAVAQAVPVVGPKRLSVRELAPTSQTRGLAYRIDAAGVRVASCRGEVGGVCTSADFDNPNSTLDVAVAAEILARRPEAYEVSIEGGAVLDLVFGGPEDSYHLVIVPSLHSDALERRPSLALRGAIDDRTRVLRFEAGQFVYFEPIQACGSATGPQLFGSVQRLDLARREFVSARMPVVQAEVTRAWTPLESAPLGRGVFLEPELGTTKEGTLWAFGARRGKARQPWANLSFFEPRSGLVVLELGPQTEPGELFLLQGQGGVRRLEVPASAEERRFVVEVREGALESLSPESVAQESQLPQATLPCVVIATGASGVEVRAIRALEPGFLERSTAELLLELGGSHPEQAEQALRARAGELEGELLRVWPRLQRDLRGRAVEVSRSFPAAERVGVLLVALFLGDEFERKQAEHELDLLPQAVVPEVLTRLLRASKGRLEAKIAVTLAARNPAVAGEEIIEHLTRAFADPVLFDSAAGRSRRRALRGALARAFRHEPTLAFGLQKVRDPALPPFVRRELMRSLPERAFARSGNELAPVLQQLWGEFAFAFPLIDATIALTPALDAAGRAKLTRRLTRGASDFAGARADAYMSHFFDRLAERGAVLPPEFEPLLWTALESPSMRVRSAALTVLGTQPALGLSFVGRREQLFTLLEKDPWPRVRALAATSYGRSSAGLPAEERDTVERRLARQLDPELDAEVARGILAGLGASAGPRARRELIRILESEAPFPFRTEAAEQLGRLCETTIVDKLTELALILRSPSNSNGQVELGLTSLRVLVWLGRADLQGRLKPLTLESVPGPLRAQVNLVIESARSRCAR